MIEFATLSLVGVIVLMTHTLPEDTLENDICIVELELQELH